MSIRAGLLIAAGVLISTAAAGAETKADAAAKKDTNACAWFSTIDDWQRLDDRNLIVWVSRKEAYHVQLSMPLFDLRSANEIAFIDQNRDGQLCGFGMDQVVVPHSPIFGSSTILGMTKVDDAAIERLAEQYKVKLGKRAKKSSESATPPAENKKP